MREKMERKVAKAKGDAIFRAGMKASSWIMTPISISIV
jgi:hypothetical protein